MKVTVKTENDAIEKKKRTLLQPLHKSKLGSFILYTVILPSKLAVSIDSLGVSLFPDDWLVGCKCSAITLIFSADFKAALRGDRTSGYSGVCKSSGSRAGGPFFDFRRCFSLVGGVSWISLFEFLSIWSSEHFSWKSSIISAKINCI